jgi:hypothetical protein
MQHTEEITLSPIKWAAPERELADITNKYEREKE